ncbi:tyrosine-protein phosphatase [Metabacillus niabensis]|uniref:Protein-tyrosine phosphatase n=1 Tax=Metabacillus niabensis TaxID=324854 RepID=A0ABT9Z3M4_9BACI|nr:tyrosine-protein phosphatase [Metabacillus niabensis]MDQ0226832.1 protein-tyrosine phosphatase [Metabacillus niabensis]
MDINVENSVYPFEGLKNFRDIGGLSTTEGYKMKTGLFYRSEDLSRLSNKDIELIKDLNITTIFDLRTSTEQKSKPNKLNDLSIKVHNLSIHDKSKEFSKIEFIKFLFSNSNTIDFEQMMHETYHYMALECHNQIREILTKILTNSNSTLIHCTGGKDRTGFVAAIIQLVAGISYNDVMQHYLESNNRIGDRMKKAERFFRFMSLYRVSPEKIKPLLEVRKEYLEGALSLIFTKYGTIDSYIIDGCGITKEQLERLRIHLLDNSI